MILKAFSEYLKKEKSDISTILLLSNWLKLKLATDPVDNIEKVIHAEIGLFNNNKGLYMLRGKTKTGKILIESLYNYALSYEQHNFNKWLHRLKASDFDKNL